MDSHAQLFGYYGRKCRGQVNLSSTDLQKIEATCDVCGVSRLPGNEEPQLGCLSAHWKSGSAHSGEQYEIRLCETCFFRTLAGLRRERMVNSLFDEDDPDMSCFEPIDTR